jgi:hypothetical protein
MKIYKYGQKVKWFKNDKIKGTGYIIGIIESCYAWIIMNDNNKIIEGSIYPTIIGYDYETNKILNNELGTIYFYPS